MSFKQAPQLILRNDSSICYMNSTFQAITWLLELIPNSLLSIHGMGADLFHKAAAGHLRSSVHLTKDAGWLAMLANWGEVHIQHDVCEFVQYLTNHIELPMLAGTWQARSPAMAKGDRPLDQGPCTQPLVLHLPPKMKAGAYIRIQTMVDEWHRCVDRLHGLHVIPSVIMLQIHRFHRKQGRIHKSHAKVQMDRTIRLPVFEGEGHHHVFQAYQLAAFIEHHGQFPTSGHYTTTLIQDQCCWLCNDGRAATAQSEIQLAQCKACYILFYIADSSAATAGC